MKKRWYLVLLRLAHTALHVDPCQAMYLGGSFLCEVFVSVLKNNINLAFLGEQQGKLPY